MTAWETRDATSGAAAWQCSVMLATPLFEIADCRTLLTLRRGTPKKKKHRSRLPPQPAGVRTLASLVPRQKTGHGRCDLPLNPLLHSAAPRAPHRVERGNESEQRRRASTLISRGQMFAQAS
ncbi:hypothetical protein MRX96_003800 [Rhipicephalus microplus]